MSAEENAEGTAETNAQDQSAESTNGKEQYREARSENESQGQQEPNFQTFLAGLYTQTLASLGAVKNPMSGEREVNLDQAQYLIDTVGMLKDKTEGNLDSDEQSYLLNLLQDLRMRYVQEAEQKREDEQSQS